MTCYSTENNYDRMTAETRISASLHSRFRFIIGNITELENH
ncbi:hypothetical protein T01_13746 [Trichinella spiralis]|uniref:Uncharacterized protein n=1 Tax=Trichinella spiralis TaxID=6334 RepID=A0A0V0YQ42_TRISP|nr:hypothetical protein T01_13746 [Trichinella spiralis]